MFNNKAWEDNADYSISDSLKFFFRVIALLLKYLLLEKKSNVFYLVLSVECAELHYMHMLLEFVPSQFASRLVPPHT